MTSGKKAVVTVHDERYYHDQIWILWLLHHEPDEKELVYPKEES